MAGPIKLPQIWGRGGNDWGPAKVQVAAPVVSLNWAFSNAIQH